MKNDSPKKTPAKAVGVQRMVRHPAAIALDAYLDSPDGKAGTEPVGTFLATAMQRHYLENRIKRAFNAGWCAAEKNLKGGIMNPVGKNPAQCSAKSPILSRSQAIHKPNVKHEATLTGSAPSMPNWGSGFSGSSIIQRVSGCFPCACWALPWDFFYYGPAESTDSFRVIIIEELNEQKNPR